MQQILTALLRQRRSAIFLLGVLLPCVLTSSSFAAQGSPVAQEAKTNGPSITPSIISEPCIGWAKTSREALGILQAISVRPTAAAYNDLGSLFAQAKKTPCAKEAFEVALRLENGFWQARYNLALALLDAEDSRSAETQLRMVIQQKPESFRAHNALGVALRKQGKTEEAANEFRAVLDLNPRFGYAANNLAEVLIEQKEYLAAVFYLQKTLAADPRDETLKYQLQRQLGIAYAGNGDFDKSVDSLRNLVAAHPRSADAHFALANVYAHLDRYRGAAEEYGIATQLDPSNNVALLSLVEALLSLGNYADALPHAKEYVRRYPQDGQGNYVLGRAYKGLGEFSEAAKAFGRAVQASPNSYEVRYNLGFALARTGNLDKAVEELEAAKELNPNATEVHYELASVLQKRKDHERADEEMRAFKLLKDQSRQPTSGGIVNNRANQLLADGNFQAAADTYREALKLDPNNAQMHYNLSLALSRVGDHAGEQHELEEAAKLDPNLAVARNQLGMIYMAEGEAAHAEQEFRTALNINPQFAEAENNLGVLYGQLGKSTEAVELFQKACENDPQYTQAYVNLALVLANDKRYLESEEKLKKAIKISPQDTKVLTALAMVEGKLGRPKESYETFQRVVVLQPSSPEARLNLGIALADQYDLRGALTEFSEAVHMAPDFAPARFNFGQVLYDLGKQNEAQKELETAVELSPKYRDALYLLALLERHLSNFVRSSELFRQLVAVEPRNANAQYLLGCDFQQLGRRREAIEHWKLALEANPDFSEALYRLSQELIKSGDPGAEGYMNRFHALEEKGSFKSQVERLNSFALEEGKARDWPRALEQLKEALRICGQCPQVAILHKNLGLIYCHKGDLGNAMQELRLALKLKPDDADALGAVRIIQELEERPRTLP